MCIRDRPLIEEVVVYGVNDKKSGDIIVKAEIFPDFAAVEEILGHARCV